MRPLPAWALARALRGSPHPGGADRAHTGRVAGNVTVKYEVTPKRSPTIEDELRWVGHQWSSKKCGFRSFESVLPVDCSQDELLNAIDMYNDDDDCHGILVQLPLPDHINQKEVLNYIDEDKDVDGFHPASVGALTRMGEELRYAPSITEVVLKHIDL